MAYKLFTREERDRQAFETYFLQPLRDLRLDVDVMLDGLSLYVGLNPDEGQGGNANRPHYVPSEGKIVIPSLFWGVRGQSAAQAALATAMHELGHHLHFKFMNDRKWTEWFSLVGKSYSFANKQTGDYDYVEVYEAFANDVQSTLNGAHDVPTQVRRLRWYARLWGQDWRPRIELFIGERRALVCGREVSLDVPAIILKDRTLVPVRFVAECMGFEVDWEPKKSYPQKVFIW